MDSKVVVGAVIKGRPSSLAFNRLMKRVAALCFAGGLVLHVAFIPTMPNPPHINFVWEASDLFEEMDIDCDGEEIIVTAEIH